MSELFATDRENVMAPARRAYAITPHASNEIDPLPRAIYVGTGGDITLRAADGSADVLFRAVPDGTWLPVRARYIRAAGTTAADLVGLA